MDFEPFCKLRDHRNRSFTLLGLWLLNVTTPVGLRNAKLVSVVIFPAKAAQSELERRDLMGAIPSDQGAVPAASTKAVSPLQEATSYRHAVKQLPKSVVREIRTLRSVGAGGGRLPSATRWGDQRWSSLPRLGDRAGTFSRTVISHFASQATTEYTEQVRPPDARSHTLS